MTDSDQLKLVHKMEQYYRTHYPGMKATVKDAILIWNKPGHRTGAKVEGEIPYQLDKSTTFLWKQSKPNDNLNGESGEKCVVLSLCVSDTLEIVVVDCLEFSRVSADLENAILCVKP